MDTYTDENGVECHDECGDPVDECQCTCEKCGDYLTDCACEGAED